MFSSVQLFHINKNYFENTEVLWCYIQFEDEAFMTDFKEQITDSLDKFLQNLQTVEQQNILFPH